MPVLRPSTNDQADDQADDRAYDQADDRAYDQADDQSDDQSDHPFCNSAGCKAKWGDTFKSERQAEPSFICGKCLKLAADEEKKNEQIEQIEQNESYDPEFYIIWFAILGLVLAFFI